MAVQPASDALTERLQRELNEMTVALSHAWDQLVPLLNDAPKRADTSADILPILQSIMSAVDAPMGAVYWASRDDTPPEWYAVPSQALTMISFLPYVEALAGRRVPVALTSVSPYNGETTPWWFTPLWVDGALAGAIGVGFADPRRELSALELRLLSRMNERAAGTLLATRLQESRAREAQIAHEIQIAGLIQRSIQPLRLPYMATVDLAAHWQPAAIVAGDAWGWVTQSSGRLAGFVLDIAGKGLPSSLWAVSLRSALNMALRLGLPPTEVIHAVNNEVYDGFAAAGLIATVTVWRYDPTSGIFEQANAGHPPTLIHSDHTWTRLGAQAPPIGVFSSLMPPTQTRILQPGDTVLCFSDGLTELETSGGLWGEVGIIHAAEFPGGPDASDVVDAIVGAADLVRLNTSINDDVTLVVLRVRPPSAEG